MRKALRIVPVLAGLLMLSFCLWAQEKTVTGTITDDNTKAPLAGVTVTNRSTGKSTQTDKNGHFSIAAQPGQVLVFTSIGFSTQELKVDSRTQYSLSLATSAKELDEVVVAMDLKRKPRELGYSVQKVDGGEISETQRENFLNSLQGRVAGLTITPTTGQAGASSSIVLRGFNSLSLSNQPLFVVDGVIVDNQTLNETSGGGGGLGLASDRPNRNNDYTNRIADINPNDIASVTILKGPEATALYGSQASSGAIVITTKRGNLNGKFDVTYDNSFRTKKINRFPNTINTYNTGTYGKFSETVPFSYFGPAYPADTKMYDNQKAFFRTGFAQTHNLSTSFGTKKSGFRLSGSYFNEDGVVPSNTFKRLNLRLSNTTKIGKYVEIQPSITYINSDNDKPLRGSYGYLLDLYQWPANYDVNDYLDKDGHKKLLYASNPNSEVDNPLFFVHKNHSQDKTDRYIATMGININPYPWLSIAGRFGYDYYKTDGYTFYHPESYLLSASQGGYLDNYYRRYNGYNHTITATVKKDIGKFSTRVMVGTMWQDYETKMYAVSGYRLKDSLGTDSSNTDPVTRIRLQRAKFGEFNESIIRQVAYFGEVGIGYNNVVFLDYTHRFETASTLPSQNRKYNYPGVSLSVILSDILPQLKSKLVNYVKLRTSYASTARLNSPYSNQSYFVDNYASGGGYSYYFTNNNYDLKPERQNTYEIGLEARLLKNRVSLDFSYYNTLAKDQIAENYRASYGTGYVLNTQNAADTRNQGIEVVMDVTPVSNRDWRWGIRFNFNHMWNKVLKIPASLTEYYLADTWLYGNARGGLVKGGPTTSITGYHYMRNDKGEILVNPANGLPVVQGTFAVIGDRNPDFTLGTLNSIQYKNWSLNFLWDLKVGGDIFNGTDEYLTRIGKSVRTADRTTPIVVKGVLKDGLENSANPTTNTIVITPNRLQDYYTTMPEEEFIEKNVNWLRLRDVTLNYSFPEKAISRIRGLKSFSLFVTASDLVLITNYSGADPAVNGNTAGAKGVGGLGFDFGNIATPIGINVGLRASF